MCPRRSEASLHQINEQTAFHLSPSGSSGCSAFKTTGSALGGAAMTEMTMASMRSSQRAPPSFLRPNDIAADLHLLHATQKGPNANIRAARPNRTPLLALGQSLTEVDSSNTHLDEQAQEVTALPPRLQDLPRTFMVQNAEAAPDDVQQLVDDFLAAAGNCRNTNSASPSSLDGVPDSSSSRIEHLHGSIASSQTNADQWLDVLPAVENLLAQVR
ncbi:unnamed protein product [Parajaminaea phylloscopi]